MYFQYYMMGIILLPAIIFSLYAQIKVYSSFNKYISVGSRSGTTACEIVSQILRYSGIYDVQILRINGDPLNNYYDPTKKVIALSSEIYNSSSISALGVACHEVGHALQYENNYAPIKLRNAIVPICNGLYTLLWPIIFIGFLLNLGATYSPIGTIFVYSGIIFFGISVVINLLTLPAEYDASNRAIKILYSTGTLTEEELDGAKEVLNSAALTYVAALLVSILNLLRFILIFGRRRR